MQYLKKLPCFISICLLLASALPVSNWPRSVARASDPLQLDVPALVHGFATAPGLPEGDLFLLPKPLQLTLTQEPDSLRTFAVSAESFGEMPEKLGLLPGVPANGFSLSTPGEVARALFNTENIREGNLMLAATVGTTGDAVRVFAQFGDSKNGQELFRLTIEEEGYRLSGLHPHLKLFVDNRFALGPDTKKDTLLPFVDEAGPRGKRTGLLTFVFPQDFDSPLRSCLQLGLELKRAQGAGTSSIVLSDLVVNRQKIDGDENNPGEGLLGKMTQGYPSGALCKTALTLNR